MLNTHPGLAVTYTADGLAVHVEVSCYCGHGVASFEPGADDWDVITLEFGEWKILTLRSSCASTFEAVSFMPRLSRRTWELSQRHQREAEGVEHLGLP